MAARARLVPLLCSTAAILVSAAALAAACSGNPYGSCVTFYTDGDVYRYDTDKQYCEETCIERMASSSVIASCFFEGARSGLVEP